MWSTRSPAALPGAISRSEPAKASGQMNNKARLSMSPGQHRRPHPTLRRTEQPPRHRPGRVVILDARRYTGRMGNPA